MQSKDQPLTPTLIVTQTLLGKGSTGNVYIGHSLTPQPHQVAIKSIPLEEINNEVTTYLLECELEALKAISLCNNSSIVKLQDIVVIGGYCHIVMEILSGGTLKDYMDKNKRIQASIAMGILRSLLLGYETIQKNGIIHRDLKPSNILFATDPSSSKELPIPKIIDFGYCIYNKVLKKPSSYYNVGSPRYMSPEAYTENQYSEKSDIWALGIIFYQMLTGACLDKGKTIVDSFEIIREKGIPIPASMDPKSRKLLQGMLMIDPKKRMDCYQLIRQIDSNEPVSAPASSSASNIKHNQQNPMILYAQSPQRASMVSTNSPLRSSTFLTRSVGFTMSPQQYQYDNRFNNLFQAKTEQSKVERNQGLATDRSNRQGQTQGRALPLSSSLQNLHKINQNSPVLIHNNRDQGLPFNMIVQRALNSTHERALDLPANLSQEQQSFQQRVWTAPSQYVKPGNNLLQLRQKNNVINFGEQAQSKVQIMQAQQNQQTHHNFGNQMIPQKGVQMIQDNGNLGTQTAYVKGQGLIVHGSTVQFHQVNGQQHYQLPPHPHPHPHPQSQPKLNQPQPQLNHHQHIIQQLNQVQQLQGHQNQQSHSNQQQISIHPNSQKINQIVHNHHSPTQQNNQSSQTSPKLHPQLSPQQPPVLQLNPQQQYQQNHRTVQFHSHPQSINLNHQQPLHPQHHIQQQQSIQTNPQQLHSQILRTQPFRQQHESNINKNIRLFAMNPQQTQTMPLEARFNENTPPTMIPHSQLIKGRI